MHVLTGACAHSRHIPSGADRCHRLRIIMLPALRVVTATAAERAGSVCLFDCIEYLREQLQQWQEAADAAEAAALAATLEQAARLSSSDGDEDDWGADAAAFPESGVRVRGAVWASGCAALHSPAWSTRAA